MSLSETIKPFTEAGFSIHWLHEQSKVPFDTAWSTLPTKTLDQLASEYRPNFNVGVRLGKFSKVGGGYLHAIDLDVRDDDKVDEAHALLESLFPNYTSLPFVISGSGGESRHFYFVTDKPFGSRKLARSPGFDMVFDPKKGRAVKKHDFEIELFGTGKQVAMPPSIHPDTGAEYEWGRSFDFDALELDLPPFIPSSHIESLVPIHEEGDGSPDDRPPLGLTLEQAEDYIYSLPTDEWCEDRDGWYQVGMALHHEFAGRGQGGAAFELWCKWSAQSSKFDLNNARTVWTSFKDNKSRNVRMATVLQAVKQARFEQAFGEIIDGESDGFDEPAGAAADDLDDLLGDAPKGGNNSDTPADDLDDLLGEPPAAKPAAEPVDDHEDLTEVGKPEGEPNSSSHDDPDNPTGKAKDDASWISRLDLDENGQPKNTFANIHLIVSNDIRTKGLFERNTLLNGDVFRRKPTILQWKKQPEGGVHQIAGPAWDIGDKISGELVLDVHVALVRKMLSAPRRRGGYSLGKPAATDVRESIEIIARNNAFHPVQEYLSSLSWDGAQRVERLFIEYLGADDNDYHRETARLTMLAAVVRAFEPGHKFDFVPVIEGGQGVRKSTFIETLAVQPMWAGALSSDFHDPARMVESMQGRWIMELAEMSGMNKSDVNDIKKFVSETEDRVRLAYEHSAANYPRQSIIMGSTNDDAYLRDDTGGRRFWPIRCQVERVGGSIPIDKLNRNIDQLWAEAVALYRSMREAQPHGNLPLYLEDAEVRRFAERLQDTRKVGSVWDDYAAQIEEWANTPVSTDDGFDGGPKVLRDKLCVPQIWHECLGFAGKPTHQDSTHIGNAMKQLSSKWERSPKLRFPKGSKEAAKYGRCRGWIRKRPENGKNGDWPTAE